MPDAHDLETISAEVHQAYFPEHSKPRILWGKRITRKKRRSIRLGSYHHAEQMIRIHPLLNSPRVPRFFVESIVFHEYLHHTLGPDHDRGFHLHERRYPHYRDAKSWLRKNLQGLLGRAAVRKPRVVIVPIPEQPRAVVQLTLF